LLVTAWKAFERRVAQSLGGRRAGPLGASVSDIVGVPFAVECKRTARNTGGIMGAWIAQAKAQGLIEGNPWLLVVARHNDRNPVVVLDFRTFVEIAKDAGLIPSEEQAVADETVFTEAGAMTVSLDAQGLPLEADTGKIETYRTNFGRTKRRP